MMMMMMMMMKCQDSYEELQSVIDRQCAELGHQPDPRLLL